MEKFNKELLEKVQFLNEARCSEIQYGAGNALLVYFQVEGFERLSFMIETSWRLFKEECIIATSNSGKVRGKEILELFLNQKVQDVIINKSTFDIKIKLSNDYQIQVLCHEHNHKRKYSNYSFFVHSIANQIPSQSLTVDWDHAVSAEYYDK